MTDNKHTAILLLILSTVGLFTVVPRYDVIEVQLNGDFLQQNKKWTAKENGENISSNAGIFVLENRDATSKVFLRQSMQVPRGVLNLRLAVEAFTQSNGQEEVSPAWARIFLIGRDLKKQWLSYYPYQQNLSKRIEGWYQYSMVTKIPPEAVELIAGMEIIQGGGIIQVRDISIESVEEKLEFRIATYILLVLWGAILLWIGKSLPSFFENYRTRSYFVFISCLIAFGAWMPGPMKNLILNEVQAEYAELVGSHYEKHSRPYYKLNSGTQKVLSPSQVGHVVLFLLLAMIVRLGGGRNSLVANFYFLMLFAMTTEALQFFTFGRVPQASDLLIDAGGIACGLAFSGLFRVRQEKR